MKSRVVKLFILVLFLCVGISGVILHCLFTYDIKEENIQIAIIDEVMPTLKVKEEKVYIDIDTNYNVYDNVEYSFGRLGGTIKCSSETLDIGRNDIECDAIGNNGMTTSKIFTVYKSATYNKNAIFFGDSITAGYASDNKSWAEVIKDKYDLNKVVNAGISDFRVSKYQRPHKWLGLEVLSHYNDNIDYDFVILQGGINDALIHAPLGKLSSTYTDDLDLETFYGGLEGYIQTVINKWPNAKIGYIITYYIPNYDDHIYSYEHFKLYYEALKEVLVKYNIPYLDLFAGKKGLEKYSEILSIYSTKFLEDNLHLNYEGYQEIAPYIYVWMQNLNKYNKTF